MIKIVIISLLFFIFTGCNSENTKKNLDGKKLLESKCASCHDLHMPPILSDDELAPPMMAVSFHVYNFVKPSDESQRVSKAVEFITDYVQNPSVEKSFCDKDSLKRYGVMPSQKENVTSDETKAIATYLLEHFTQENLTKNIQAKERYEALPNGEKIALKYKCLGCHKIDKKIVGPSFQDIAKKYQNSKEKIKKAIRYGSKSKWENSNGAVMPSFKQISDKDLESLQKWILSKNMS